MKQKCRNVHIPKDVSMLTYLYRMNRILKFMLKQIKLPAQFCDNIIFVIIQVFCPFVVCFVRVKSFYFYGFPSKEFRFNVDLFFFYPDSQWIFKTSSFEFSQNTFFYRMQNFLLHSSTDADKLLPTCINQMFHQSIVTFRSRTYEMHCFT